MCCCLYKYKSHSVIPLCSCGKNKIKRTESKNCRGCKGPLGIIMSNPLPKQVLCNRCTGEHPGRSWLQPEKEPNMTFREEKSHTKTENSNSPPPHPNLWLLWNYCGLSHINWPVWKTLIKTRQKSWVKREFLKWVALCICILGKQMGMLFVFRCEETYPTVKIF